MLLRAPCIDFVVVAQSCCLCVLTSAFLFYTGVWYDLSVSLDMTPWRDDQDAALAAALAAGTPPQGVDLRCPFYKGEALDTQCVACGTVVSRSGLHKVRPLVHVLAASGLSWGRGRRARRAFLR